MWRLIAGVTLVALLRPSWSRALSKESLVAAQRQVPPPKAYKLETIRAFPHEGMPFTQGLEIHSDGQRLVETSGSYPPGTKSFVRILDPATGNTIQQDFASLEGSFVEGIVQANNGHWFASTYTDKKAIEYDSNLNMIKEHEYPGMGWGLTRTTDGASFIATNGSEYVMTLQKGSFQPIDTKVVTCLGKRVTGLNELEMVDDFMGQGPTLLGNVYLSRLVLAVNPATGECIGTFNLGGLGVTESSEISGFHAANGLAYNKSSETLYVTGKNWDQMFETKVVEDPQGLALTILAQHLQSAAPSPDQAMLLQVSSSGEPSLKSGDYPKYPQHAKFARQPQI